MLLLTLFCIGGLFAGLLLLRKAPVLTGRPETKPEQLLVSVVIPARNEENNLPLLLESLRSSESAALQVLVVDDGSTDDTAGVATRYGATVITSSPLPDGWTGKTWACHQGALAATGEAIFFLDADTRFVPGGYLRIVERFATLPRSTALSLLPFHRMEYWYEELSLFFNILVAMGAGGFGKLDAPHLFGQALLIRKEMYASAGGYQSVRGEILENLRFAAHVLAASGNIFAVGGRGTLEMRMFPHGLAQLRESWQKGFVAAAGSSSFLVLGLSVCWLASATLIFLMLFVTRNFELLVATSIYLLFAVQIAWYGRQLGTFRWATALFYPAPLAFYFALFAQSTWRQKLRRPVTWRGRQL